jgi:hypothetical protein
MKILSAFFGMAVISVSILQLGPAYGTGTPETVGGGASGQPGGPAGSAQGSGGAIVLQLADAASPSSTDPSVPTEVANCGLVPIDVARRPADLLLVLDRSGSMSEHKVTGANGDQVTRAQATKDAVDAIVEKTQRGIVCGLKMFPEGDAAYCVVTADKVDVALALNNYAAILLTGPSPAAASAFTASSAWHSGSLLALSLWCCCGDGGAGRGSGTLAGVCVGLYGIVAMAVVQ